MPLLFVYGTLMRGESNHGQLGGARFVEIAHTEPAFSLVDLGEYPALLARGRDSVAGELYEADEVLLAKLDLFEEPEHYARATVRLRDGREVLAYLLDEAFARAGRRIESGDWKRRE